MLVVNTATHAIMAAVPSVGPTPDIDQLEEVLDQVPQSITIKRMVLGAGFDSASNHQLLRDYHGILSVIPPLHGRPPRIPIPCRLSARHCCAILKSSALAGGARV